GRGPKGKRPWLGLWHRPQSVLSYWRSKRLDLQRGWPHGHAKRLSAGADDPLLLQSQGLSPGGSTAQHATGHEEEPCLQLCATRQHFHTRGKCTDVSDPSAALLFQYPAEFSLCGDGRAEHRDWSPVLSFGQCYRQFRQHTYEFEDAGGNESKGHEELQRRYALSAHQDERVPVPGRCQLHLEAYCLG